MRKVITRIAFAIFLVLGINPLFAGAGHDHSHDHGHNYSHSKINEAQAKKIAIKIMNDYVLEGKLHISWKNTPVKSVKAQVYKGTPEWVFNFNNPKEPKVEHKNLYIFVNEYGEMAGANFDGK